jgi:hypothetical protein
MDRPHLLPAHLNDALRVCSRSTMATLRPLENGRGCNTYDDLLDCPCSFGHLTCAEIDHFVRHWNPLSLSHASPFGIKYGFLLPKLRHPLPAPRFCSRWSCFTPYPQSAETHHDRIMNPTAAVVTRVCSLAPRFVLVLRCAEGGAVIKKARDKLRAVLIHDCEAVRPAWAC